MIEWLAALVVLAPFSAAAWIGLGLAFGRDRGEAAEVPTARAAIAGAGAALLALLVLDVIALAAGAPGQVHLGTWIESGSISVAVSFTLDPLALTLATLAAAICLATLRFSVAYMHREAGFRRFFMILSLFTGAMLVIFTAGNAVLTFVGWELAGVSSYLLIGYVWHRPQATGNAVQAFVTNRVGDAGFLLAIFSAFAWLGTTEWPALALARAAGPGKGLEASLVLLGFVVAAAAKSAQVPFSAWIGRALEGPTPSSAVFYGAVMVHAGVYLLIRLGPLFEQTPALMPMVAFLGVLTALYGWLIGLTRADVKSGLMASVTTQVGLMFLWCGLGWFELATVHLVLHALWRIWQFLHAPALMHLTHAPAAPVPTWLARRRRLYTAALQGFWLDPAADWLLMRPTRQLARDVQTFDETVIDRLAGPPSQGAAPRRDDGLGGATGILGGLMERVAAPLHWFEEHLVLAGAGEGLTRAIRLVGDYVQQIESLLARPRYLLLLILATFVVIL